MSSLHHDRLLEEGAAPADPVAAAAAPAPGATGWSGAAVEGEAGSPVPPQRRGKAESAGGCRVADTPTGRVGAAVLTAEAATARVAPDAPVRPTPYKRGVADRVPVAPVVDVEVPLESIGPVVVVKGAPVPPTPSRALVRSTPADVTVGDAPADPEGVVAAVAQGRRGVMTRGLPSVARRPALYLASALIGALSISGASAVPTEVQTQPLGHSVSVAEQLGIEATAPAVVDEESASHLRGLVTSRNARDAERTAAAEAQAEADRLAAEEAARAAVEAARPQAVHPVEGARLTSVFGARWGTVHAGIDLAAPMRTPERAVMDGVVLEAGAASGYGLVVYIQHENGDVTLYGHMDEILVEPGQIVRAGDTIALLGNRGQSTGPHLHFEVHVGGLDGQKVDPLPWLRQRGVHI